MAYGQETREEVLRVEEIPREFVEFGGLLKTLRESVPGDGSFISLLYRRFKGYSAGTLMSVVPSIEKGFGMRRACNLSDNYHRLVKAYLGVLEDKLPEDYGGRILEAREIFSEFVERFSSGNDKPGTAQTKPRGLVRRKPRDKFIKQDFSL